MKTEEGEKYIMDPLIQELTKEQIRDDIPAFRAGDTVTVHVRVVEGTHERIQLFEGVVIKKKGTGIGATYTVRKIASGVGVERTFPVNDPRVAKVEVKRHGRVRRATASQQELLKHVVNKMKNGRFVRIDYFFTLVCEND